MPLTAPVMFPLLRYFTLASAAAILAVTAVFAFLLHASMVEELVRAKEVQNVHLARAFANSLWPEYRVLVVDATNSDAESLRWRPEAGHMHEDLVVLSKGLPVLKVKIYSLDGTTVYSSEASQIGENKLDSEGFGIALTQQQPSSKLSFRDRFQSFAGIVTNRQVVETYVPIRGPDGNLEGILELYSDVTDAMEMLRRGLLLKVAISLSGFALLYLMLLLIVQRADGILKRQYNALLESEASIQQKKQALELEAKERHRAEEELRRARDELEARVVERTRDLSNEVAQHKRTALALREAKEGAEAASRAKSEFLANMSHEIRTPMNGVLGMTGLLLDSDLGEEERQYALTIRQSGEALLTILNDILDFSKIEAGKLELEFTAFDVVALVEGVQELLGNRAFGKGLEMPAFIAPEVPRYLYGDEGRIRQILLNLAGNAIKFTEAGGVSIEVKVAVEEIGERDALIRFEVKDSGIGIAPEVQGRIFDQFTQADNSVTRRYGGTGLGLTICKRLVDLMGGEIGVESAVGRGSTFWFTLRLERRPGQLERWSDPDGRCLQGRRAMVVDDSAVNRVILEKQLHAFGMVAETAATAAEALARLQAAAAQGQPFDIAIIDHLMPETDGVALCRQIEAEAAFGDLRLVLTSSSGLVNSHAAAQELGFDAALPKPFRPGAVLRCLGALFAPSDEAPVRPGGVRSTRAPAGPKGRRLLVAEDNPVNQAVAVAILEAAGLRVDAVANGLEAVEAIRNRPYDLVLMDVQMPEMDGLAATRRIRALNSARSDIPIIAVTAHAMKGDKERCLQAGMNDYIAKPIDRVQLLEKVAYWLSAAPERAAAPGRPDGSLDGAASAS
ncbi:MAG: response regulator [Kiloniellales bacterium]